LCKCNGNFLPEVGGTGSGRLGITGIAEGPALVLVLEGGGRGVVKDGTGAGAGTGAGTGSGEVDIQPAFAGQSQVLICAFQWSPGPHSWATYEP
jgi:hypothetical protein